MVDEAVEDVLAGFPLAVLLIGPDERVIAANDPARALFGAAVTGRHYVMSLRQPGMQAAIGAALTKGTAGQGRHVIQGPSHEVTYRVTVSRIAALGAALCAFEDITEAEEAGRMRRDFVANVSHELRTPLTALLGFIETLRNAAQDDPAARDRFLAIMEREAGRMNRLIRDLLHLSRVEAQERVRPTERVDIAAVIASAVAALRPQADGLGVRIAVEAGPGPWVVTADPDQMAQVFTNLIENAVKYGGSGGAVTVALRHDALPAGPAVRADVTDRGEGIDPLHIPRLTERFYRVDGHRSREKGGTGLGLAIVKHIVNRHRGRMKIESARGKGSTFSVILPLS